MSEPSSKDRSAKLPETAHERSSRIAGDQAPSQAPPYAYDHGILTNYNLAASYTTIYGDSTDRDWQDVALLFVSTLRKVNVLNEAIHHAYQVRDTRAFALCDDFIRNFHRCLRDRILALSRGEAHDVPGHKQLPGASMIRWAVQNASKATVDSSTQTMDDEDPPHSIPEGTVDLSPPNIEGSHNMHSRTVPAESIDTTTVPYDNDERNNN